MQVSFYLDKSNKNKEGYAPVFYSLTFNNDRIRKRVKGVVSKESEWNRKQQRIKPPLKSQPYNNHIEYNKVLDEFEGKVKVLFRYILLNDIVPTKDFINTKLKDGINVNLNKEFWSSFNEFIETSKTTKVERTIKSYTTTKNFLENFEKETGYELYFETITREFFEKLQDYTFLEKKNKNSYLAFLIKILKTFMTWAYEREYHDNLQYKKFRAKEDETEVIYLTMDELLALYNHKFETKKHEHVRDTYCFACFTGLRFSDIKQLRPSNIFEDYIKLNIQKTKVKDHIVPLNNYSKAILRKYKDTIYEPLPVISGQKFNKYIKECCKKVKINKQVTITRYIGQKRIDKTYDKHELITSHTGRKTFATNSLIMGMNEMIVRNITGLKGSSFNRYVKIANDFKQQEMDNTWNKIEKDEQ